MIGIVFVAMFIGSLSAVNLVFSGWPLWVAMATYMFSGILGLAVMAVAESYRAPLSRGIRRVIRSTYRLNYWRHKDDTYLESRPIPALSEYEFTTMRK